MIEAINEWKNYRKDNTEVKVVPAIYAKKFQWYIGDEEWTGAKTFELEPEQKEVITVMKAWIS